jgi:CubicO group peptidase (beta-lactamase class C family)
LSAELRETFQYNNLCYDSLGLLPEILVGESLSAYVDRHIFQPLGMVNSTYSIAKAEKGDLADGFQISGEDLKRGLNGTKKPIIPFFERPGDLEQSISAGSGGIISSARDMVRSLF